jgi:hypothetical protein
MSYGPCTPFSPHASGLPPQPGQRKSRASRTSPRREPYPRPRQRRLPCSAPRGAAAFAPNGNASRPCALPRQKGRLTRNPPPLFSMRCALLCEPPLPNGPLFSYSCALLLPQLPCFDSHATCPMFFSIPNLKPRGTGTPKTRKGYDPALDRVLDDDGIDGTLRRGAVGKLGKARKVRDRTQPAQLKRQTLRLSKQRY